MPDDPSNPLGAATPRQRIGNIIAGRPQHSQPMITIDPTVLTRLGQMKQAVAGLKTEFQALATAAERFQRAGGTTAAGGGGGSGTGSRPQNFSEPMSPGGGKSTGVGPTGAPLGGRSVVRQVAEAEAIPSLIRFGTGQAQSVLDRERVTNVLGVMNSSFRLGGGAYTGTGTRDAYSKMLRGVGGYTSSSDLYGGASILGQIGALRGMDTGAGSSQDMVKQAGLLGRLTGGGMTQGAGIMANLRSAPTMIGLQQLGVPVSPGGKMKDPTSIFEGLYNRTATARGKTGQDAKDIFKFGQAPGSGLDVMMDSLGFDDKTKQAFLLFGSLRADKGSAFKDTKEFNKAVGKNIDSAAANMQKFQESMAKLKDSLATSIIPFFTGMANVIAPVLNTFSKFTDNLNTAGKALVALGVVATATSVKMALTGGGGGLGGLIKGTAPIAATEDAAAVEGTGLAGTGMAAGLMVTGLGLVGAGLGYGAKKLIGGKKGTTKGKLGSAAQGALTGAGVGAGIGGVLGAGVFSVPGAALGGAIGGIAGGIGGFFMGDGSQEGKGDPDYSDKGLLAHPPPAATTPTGGPLRGAGNSSNLNPEFVKRLQAMFAENPQLTLVSGWRSHEEQAYLRWLLLTKQRSKPVAPVGTSRHESGYAADIGPASQYKWLAANAPRYGLTLPMPGVEDWHWELPKGAGGGWTAPASTPIAGTSDVGNITAGLSAASGAASTPAPVAVPASRSRSAAISGGTGGSMNEADWVSNFFSNSAARGSGGGADTGDPVGTPMYSGGAAQRNGGDSIVIHNLTLTVQLAKGTPEEAEKTARYLMELLSDRTRLQTLASR